MESLNCSLVASDPVVKTFYLYWFIGVIILSSFCLVFFAFAKYRLRLERLRVRSAIPIFGSFLAVVSVTSTGVLLRAVMVPCWYRLMATVLVIPFVGVSVIIRLMLIVLLNRYALLLQVRLMEDLDENDDDEYPQRKGPFKCCRSRISISTTWNQIKALIVISDEDFSRFTKQRRLETLRSLNFLRGFQGNIVLFCALLSPFVFAVAITFITRAQDIFYNTEDCDACRSVMGVWSYFVIAVAVVVIFFMLFAILRLRRLVDPWGLKHELHWVLFFCHLALVFYIIERAVSSPIDSFYDTSILVSASVLIVLIIQTLYQIYVGWDKRLEPSAFSNHQNGQQNQHIHNLALYPPIYPFQNLTKTPNNNEEGGPGAAVLVSNPQQVSSAGAYANPVGTSQPVARSTRNKIVASSDHPTHGGQQPQSLLLGSVLANAEFESHLVAELSMEYLLFLKDCHKWKDHYPLLHPDLRLTRARRIYNQYVDQWGLYAIVFPSNIANDIAASLGRHKKHLLASASVANNGTGNNNNGEAELKISVFDEAVAYVSQLLETGALTRFQATQINSQNHDSQSRDAGSLPPSTPTAAGAAGDSSLNGSKIPSDKTPRVPFSSATTAGSSSSPLNQSAGVWAAGFGGLETSAGITDVVRTGSSSPKPSGVIPT